MLLVATMKRFWPLAVTAACGFLLPLGSHAGETAAIQFNRDVRPILSDNCYLCHGPDKNNRKAKLRLDDRAIAVEKGAIVPGKPNDSELIKRILNSDPEEVMPPKETHKTLTDQQKQTLKDWIAAGAEYEPHWAYIAPKRFPAPKVKNAKWVRNPVDAFILQPLEAKSIQPSPEADKRTLLRRLSLDLTGLPPSPEEAEAFLKDRSSKAYEKQVERLLSSPHFGERMAVPWLDEARFTDTVGYHGDQNQNVFPYRDYVIDSFNKNKPFDQFTTEQLAGDLLPNPTAEQRVATTFNRLNMMTREGGAQPREYLAKYSADRVRTVATTWMGSTMACCECHDHKYDPFSAKDFYAMSAFFADLKQWGVYADYGYTPNPDLKGYGNDHPFPPEIEVDNGYLQNRIASMREKIFELETRTAIKIKSDAQRDAELHRWAEKSLAFLRRWNDGWAVPQPEVVLKAKDGKSESASHFTVANDSTITFTNPPKENIEVTLPLSEMWIAGIRLEVIPQAGATEKMGKKARNGTSISLSAALKSANKQTKLQFFHSEADHKEKRYAGGASIVGVNEMWRITPVDERQTAVWILDKPLRVTEGDRLVLNLGAAALETLRVSVTPLVGEDPLQCGASAAFRKVLEKPVARSNLDRVVLTQTYLRSTTADESVLAETRKYQREILACRNGRAFVQISEAREPATTRLLPRGNWQDESGEIVRPAPPHFLPQPPNPDGRRLTRLDLAKWLVAPENPLTSRTFVNRLWKQYFGMGISAVVDDLGAQGEWPTHPELLDWLSVEFRESGWDMKHMVRLLVTSSTYRQISNLRPELRDSDPANRLLASQSPRRLDAEFVRDNALAISGLINLDIGGPSAKPYQPAGYYANLQFPDRDYAANLDDRQYRRGIYSHWQRTFLHPMLANFDAPSREECTANRNMSNTPQQGLTLLNDPSFVEASRVFAAKTLTSVLKNDDQRLDYIFERALAREVRPNERESLQQFLSEQREHYRTHAEEVEKLLKVGLAPAPASADKVELAAWTQVCRVVLNLHETITRY
jgi:hypothetical protein